MYLLKLESRVWDSNWFGSKQMICELWLKSERKMRTLWTLNHFWIEHEMRIFLKLEGWNWFVANKWFANFEPKLKGKCLPCGTWINFQLSPKMQRKSARAGTWIANFWLNLFVLRACRIIFIIWRKMQY